MPERPRLFLVDGYALIYRAFYALIARPLTTSKGENTSAVFGIANFLQRLVETHKPEYIGWVHDSGLSFRHETYPAYKATREKLSQELQADFDLGMERIHQLLEAYRIPVITLPGFEADDVIGTLVAKSVAQKLNVIIVSADKDFVQLIRPGVWLLNPGRGGSAGVDENWLSVDNAVERLGVPPHLVTDYLALVGDSSDNVPGVRGIGDKTAVELVNTYGDLESILAHATEITKKRPREALIEHEGNARLSKELVTIRANLDIDLSLDALQLRGPDNNRLRNLFVELEFHVLAKAVPVSATDTRAVTEQVPVEKPVKNYRTIDSVEGVTEVVAAARKAGTISIDTETLIDADSPQKSDALRSKLVSLSIAVASGEAFYFPLGHVERRDFQNDLLIDAPGDRAATDASEDRGLIRGGDEPVLMYPKKKPKTQAPISIAATLLAGNRGQRRVTNLPPLASPEMKALKDLLEDPAVKKSGQNVKYDVLVLRRAGVNLRGLDFDTMLASYVLDPGRRSHGLDVLALEFLDRTMTSYVELCGKGRTAIPFDECPVDAARDYSCEDADVILQLRAIFEPQLTNTHARELFDQIEMPLVNVLAEVEWTGITIDLPWFKSLKERFRAEREAVEEQIYDAAGTRFNINSNLQLREILFTKLELPVLKKTSTGPSTDASVLQEMADAGHLLPKLLMEYRELAKLESTYLDALPELVNPTTGRLHTSFNQTVAATGRLSSSDPNLQNIPVRRELGRDIRRGFIPRQGWTLVAADYSQIELRLLAHLSGDPAFVEAFNAGGDIHKQTAAIIFDVPINEVNSEMRSRAKTINFATIYGQGAHALSRQLKIDHSDAKAFISRYFERFIGIRQYLDSMVDFARENGYVQTIFGRRRYIPELRERNFNVRAFGERTAANSPIQGSAADLIKIAMIRIDRSLRDENLASKMLLQVHDELVFESPSEELAALEGIVRREMENAAKLSVPLVVDVGHGANWIETKA
ncbi:MAG TPA: DNA polymerase I [Gemmatimonadaceae bacterium]|nr:DNA polymerase I [Gemmatimonadaceae bacterium]